MVDISKISNRVAARRLSYDFDYFDVREEKPWRYAEVDPYDWAIMKLREPLSRWTEFPSKKLKNQITETWQEFHPELKQAIHGANRRALKDPVVWRVEPKGSFPTDLGGYSVHDTLEPNRIGLVSL